jgi:hypothetical protein
MDDMNDDDPVDMRQNILTTVSDLVANFMYYDRKEDEDLPLGAIEKAVKNGLITEDDIVQQFRDKLKAGLKK